MEDSGAGLYLAEKLVDIYFSTGQIDVKSFGGMKNLKSKIEEVFQVCNADDKIILVYDNIMENPLIIKWFRQANNFINKSEFKNIITWIPTDSFELEILMINDIEYFTNIKIFVKYIKQIKEWYDTYKDTSYLTLRTKDDNIYDSMYASIRNKKQKSSMYKSLTSDEFERTITIESLSKVLLNLCFNGQPINKPMTECWQNPCCFRRNQCKSKLIDIEKIISKQKEDSCYKVNLLIHNTSYIKILGILSGMVSVDFEYKKYNIEDIINDNTATEFFSEKGD